MGVEHPRRQQDLGAGLLKEKPKNHWCLSRPGAHSKRSSIGTSMRKTAHGLKETSSEKWSEKWKT